MNDPFPASFLFLMFLSPSVLMHSVLFCIAFYPPVCPSATGLKHVNVTRKRFPITVSLSLAKFGMVRSRTEVTLGKVKGHIGRDQIRIPNKGR